MICAEDGQARVAGLLRYLGPECHTHNDGITNVYAGIYGDVYNWISETMTLNTPQPGYEQVTNIVPGRVF